MNCKDCGVEATPENTRFNTVWKGKRFIECVKRYVKAYRAKNAERVRQVNTAWRKANPERAALIHARSRKNRLEKIRAEAREYAKVYGPKNKMQIAVRAKTRGAIKSGMLLRQPCWICGSEKSEPHHSHYGEPLMVTWLCRKHHAETHQLAKEIEREQSMQRK